MQKPQKLPKKTYNVCIWHRRGGASAERRRSTYNGLLDWATALLKRGMVDHIDVNRYHETFTLAYVGGKLTHVGEKR